jgi:hypothetical protein
MTFIEIMLISVQVFTAVLLIVLMVKNAQQSARSQAFEERAATHSELARTAERLTARLEELEGRLPAKTDLQAAIADLPRRSDLSSALDSLPKTNDVIEATKPLAHKTDLKDATIDLAKKSDVEEALKPYPTNADFNALMDSLLARQTSEVAHRLDTLAEEIAASSQPSNGASMALPQDVSISITGKSVDAAMALFDATEELVTAAAVPLQELPRDGGVSIVEHQHRCQSRIENVLSAQRAVHMLFPEGNPVRTNADTVCASAVVMREELRSNYETMNRAALNGAEPGNTSAQRLAFRQAEQRAVDAQSQYTSALEPVRGELNQAFERYSAALNSQIHGTESVTT